MNLLAALLLTIAPHTHGHHPHPRHQVIVCTMTPGHFGIPTPSHCLITTVKNPR